MARYTSTTLISNALISSQQLLAFRQQQMSQSLADVAMFRLSLLTQSAGVLLRLPQEVIATSIIILQRFVLISASDNNQYFISNDANLGADSHSVRASSAAVYLAAKQSFYPLSPRSVINVYALLTSKESSPLPFIRALSTERLTLDPPENGRSFFVSEGAYQSRREKLFAIEKTMLASLGFDTKTTLPYNLALTYLQALSISNASLAGLVLAYLNAALLSPQLLYLTHQPHSLAVAAIYLTAREQDISLVDDEVAWWEVFDVGREELGFLVLSLGSTKGFVGAQKDLVFYR